MNVDKVKEFMLNYFEARSKNDYEAVWELIYDPYDGGSKESFDKLRQQEESMRAKMPKELQNIGYQLISVGEPVRRENYDVDRRWNGGWFVDIVYKDFREHKMEIVVHEIGGKILLNWCKMI